MSLDQAHRPRAARCRRRSAFLAGGYLRLVRRTNRFTVEPANADPWLDGAVSPFIAGMWHGQHIMMLVHAPAAATASPRSSPRTRTATSTPSRWTGIGVRVIRASGARGRAVQRRPRQGRRRGPARDAAGPQGRRVGGLQRRRAEGLAPVRCRHPHPGALLRPADRPRGRGDEPAPALQQLGPRLPRAALRPRARWCSARRSTCRATVEPARRSRRCAATSRPRWTASMPAPTRWSGVPTGSGSTAIAPAAPQAAPIGDPA